MPTALSTDVWRPMSSADAITPPSCPTITVQWVPPVRRQSRARSLIKAGSAHDAIDVDRRAVRQGLPARVEASGETGATRGAQLDARRRGREARDPGVDHPAVHRDGPDRVDGGDDPLADEKAAGERLEPIARQREPDEQRAVHAELDSRLHAYLGLLPPHAGLVGHDHVHPAGRPVLVARCISPGVRVHRKRWPARRDEA